MPENVIGRGLYIPLDRFRMDGSTQRKEVPMNKTALVALGFAAAIVAAPAFAECPGHTGTTAQTSAPAPVAHTTAPTEEDQVILTQIETSEEDAQ
jgi:hypothetical protein